MITYSDARAFIAGLSPRGIRPGLNNITELTRRLGSPQNYLCAVHIAGTNGKGSAGAFLGSILNAAGLDVGRFVSPAVADYLEAFTYNAEPVSEEIYARAIEKTADAATKPENIFITPFEAETAAAFLMFKELAPDYALIECGMGGELDATNVIEKPFVSVITSISMDHSRFLGETLSEITREKCGIIKEGCPVVTCSQTDEVMDTIVKTAQRHSSPLFIADGIEKTNYEENRTRFEFEGGSYEIPLLGVFQPQNAAIAVKTAQILGISSKTIRAGLKNTKWEYRFERIGKYILDGAHNKAAATALADSLKAEKRRGKTAFICGCFADKDYGAIARETAALADAVYCVEPPSKRALDGAELARAFSRSGARAYDAKTLENALRLTREYDSVAVFGSLSILSEAKKLIAKENDYGKM